MYKIQLRYRPNRGIEPWTPWRDYAPNPNAKTFRTREAAEMVSRMLNSTGGCTRVVEVTR